MEAHGMGFKYLLGEIVHKSTGPHKLFSFKHPLSKLNRRHSLFYVIIEIRKSEGKKTCHLLKKVFN